MKKIGIVGAGVSGLTLACLLKKNTDYDITIFEKDNLKFNNINGIQISPNAYRILSELNFDSFDQRKLCKILGVSFHDYYSNSKIATMIFNLNDQSYITLNRSDLINFLIDKKKKIFYYPTFENWIDIGNKKDLQKLLKK